MSSIVKTAVVGVGHLGRYHAQKLKQLESAELVAICDVDTTSGKEFAQELGTTFIESFKELPETVEAVVIATPTTSHYELGRYFLEKGVHVQLEKPITETAEQAHELCEIAKRMNCVLQVGHVERFNEALNAAQGQLRQKPLFIECHRLAPFKPRSTDVDVVLDLMIHDLDVILSLVNSPIARVDAVGLPVVTPRIDIANARLEFESGTIANVTASRVSDSAVRKFRVFQPEQYLSIDFGEGEVKLTSQQNGNLNVEAWSTSKGDALLSEDRSFIEAIQGKSKCRVPGEDGALAVELAEQVMQKIHERNK